MIHLRTIGIVLTLAGVCIAVGSATAHDRRKKEEVFVTSLAGTHEAPLSVSSGARGSFRAVIDEEAGTLTYRLSYEGFVAPGTVTQAHIHFGERHTAGGISVFLCSNAGNGPPGTPACPLESGTVTGTLDSAAVIGPAAQGIAAGEFAELVRAIRAGAGYANVHSTAFPGGEIRGQLERR
jgi:hypothetical protein